MAVATGGDYGQQDLVQFDCAPGSTCNDAIGIDAADYGTVMQAEDNFWYTLTPNANGMYEFSSCGAECNTTLYIYDYCNMGNFDDTNEGSIYYDDNQGGCGEAATMTVLLEGGQTYWVRWASLWTAAAAGSIGRSTTSDLRRDARIPGPATTTPARNWTTGRASTQATPTAPDRT